MVRRNIIVIGASAGGVWALWHLVQGLPADLPAAVFIVVHLSAKYPSALPHILQNAGNLPVVQAVDGAEINPMRIYIAPPDRHLLVKPDCMRVVFGPRENRFRPAIDPLFRTAAVAYGKRVIGIVLSGALDDGTAGLAEIKEQGGVAVVQDPQEAFFTSMPQSAIKHVAVDHILPVADIARILKDLVEETSAMGIDEEKPL